MEGVWGGTFAMYAASAYKYRIYLHAQIDPLLGSLDSLYIRIAHIINVLLLL